MVLRMYDIYPILYRMLCLSVGSPIKSRFSLCFVPSRSLVLWWLDVPLVHEFQMGDRRCKHGAVYNCWLAPVTACGSWSKACGVEITRGKTWVGFNYVLGEIFILEIDKFALVKTYLLKKKHIKFETNIHFINDGVFCLLKENTSIRNDCRDESATSLHLLCVSRRRLILMSLHIIFVHIIDFE